MKSKSIFQIITAVFLCIPLIVVCQLPDIRLTEKPGKAIMNLPDGKSLLYEQSSVPSNEGAVSSQEFPDYPSYSTQATDDFFVPEGQTWVIEEISVLGQYSSGGGPSQMANLFILQNNPVGNEPGEPFTEYMDFPVISTPEGNLHFDLLNAPGFGPLVLNPGHYWISIQPDMAYEPYGQWYWNKQESPTLNQEFYWRNPGGGFGIGCIDWTAASLVPWGQPVEDLNLSFSLFGNYTSVILCPIVFAGNDATIMAGNSYFTGDAYAMNFSELMWNSTGNGTFSDPLVLNSWYDPWLGDLLNPSVLELCLTALPIPPCMEIVTDCMTLTIIPGPIVVGSVADMYGNPVPEDAIYIEANPWCFPSDILSTENGGIIYRIENGQGFYEFNYTMF
ncbi:MAG: hypothetical protein IH598_06295, partial [Bacteroidales bacterium]|nr:hypothetical protein [Bacteroidales bacterium]